MSLIRQFVAVFGIATLMRRAMPRLVPIVLVATQASCAMSNGEPSQVGQSKKYVTGQAKFDAFFAALHQHQLKLGKAPAEEQDVRRNFAKELAENEQASASALGKAVRKRVEQLARAGVSMRIELEDEDEQSAKADVIVGGRALGETDKTFVIALGRAARDELKLSLGMARSRRALEELRFSAAFLENEIDTAFRKGGPRKKAEVRKNMQDALTLFPVMISRAGEVEANAEKFLRKLMDAARFDPPISGEGLAVQPEDGPASSGRSPARGGAATVSKPGLQNPAGAAPARATPAPPAPNKAQPPAAPAPDFEP